MLLTGSDEDCQASKMTTNIESPNNKKIGSAVWNLVFRSD